MESEMAQHLNDHLREWADRGSVRGAAEVYAGAQEGSNEPYLDRPVAGAAPRSLVGRAAIAVAASLVAVGGLAALSLSGGSDSATETGGDPAVSTTDLLLRPPDFDTPEEIYANWGTLCPGQIPRVESPTEAQSEAQIEAVTRMEELAAETGWEPRRLTEENYGPESCVWTRTEDNNPMSREPVEVFARPDGELLGHLAPGTFEFVPLGTE
jgi:hypothetical protein